MNAISYDIRKGKNNFLKKLWKLYRLENILFFSKKSCILNNNFEKTNCIQIDFYFSKTHNGMVLVFDNLIKIINI